MFRALLRIFDYSGRSSRWEYWSFLIGAAVIGFFTGVGLAAYQEGHNGQSPQLTPDTAAITALTFLALFALPGLSLKVRRYHDFGWSGWAVLWSIVPLANVVMELMLLFRGSAAPAVDTRTDYDPRPITIYTAPASASAGHPQSTHIDQIARLADLHAQGALTADEFATAKARVLRS